MKPSGPARTRRPSKAASGDGLLAPGAIHPVMAALTEAVKKWRTPVVTEMGKRGTEPFRVLVACVLSTRTKDEVTAQAAERLFEAADGPDEMARLGEARIARLIYPVGFYKTKARHIVALCRELSGHLGGRVPDEMEELLKLPGVGRKTANLVLTQGFGKPGICVDTHVHRISNRLGYVRTSTPEQTEFALREKLPAEHWRAINDLLVAFGQHCCTPISPHCSRCPVEAHCRKVGVERSR